MLSHICNQIRSTWSRAPKKPSSLSSSPNHRRASQPGPTTKSHNNNSRRPLKVESKKATNVVASTHPEAASRNTSPKPNPHKNSTRHPKDFTRPSISNNNHHHRRTTPQRTNTTTRNPTTTTPQEALSFRMMTTKATSSNNLSPARSRSTRTLRLNTRPPTTTTCNNNNTRSRRSHLIMDTRTTITAAVNCLRRSSGIRICRPKSLRMSHLTDEWSM